MFGFLDTAWAIALALLIAAASSTLVPAFSAASLVGTGWGQWAAIGGCLLCVSGGLGILAGGPAAITAAACTPGGALLVAGCVASCGAAIQ